jgi:hypothetical protein
MRNALAISVFAASSLLLAGPVYAAKVFQARTSATTPLSATVNDLTTVLQIAIPAGRWVIQAKTQAVNFGTLETVRCQLFKGTTSLDGSGTNVGSTDGLPFVAMLVNQAVTKTTTTTIISFKCTHTEGTQSGLFLDPGSSLIIEEVVP